MNAEQRAKRNAAALEHRGKRAVRRQLKRLKHAEDLNRVSKYLKATRRNIRVRMDRLGPQGQLVFLVQTGLFGHSTGVVLRAQDEEIVGAIEDTRELTSLVSKLGLLTLSALVNYNIAEGPDGLPAAVAKWARIDVEALRAAAAEDDDGDTKREEVSGDVPAADNLGIPPGLPDGVSTPEPPRL